MANIREVGLGILATANLYAGNLLEKGRTAITNNQQPQIGFNRQLSQLEGYISDADRQEAQQAMSEDLALQVFDSSHSMDGNPLGGIIFRYGEERISRLRKDTLNRYVKEEAIGFLIKQNRQKN